MSFTHLHNHSMGSLLDGFSTPEELAKAAKRIGSDSIALTDHGSLSAIVSFYEACQREGIKPIIGVEAYLADDMSRRDKDDEIFHIVLLARTERGLKNIFAYSEASWAKGFYKKPRIDLQTLNSIGTEGVVALSGCMQGAVAKSLRNGDMELAKRWNNSFRETFQDYYLEVQPWNSKELNEQLLDLSEESGVPAVCTADTHYAFPEDKVAEEINLIIQQFPSYKNSEKDAVASRFTESRKKDSLLERINFLHPHRKLRYDAIENWVMSEENIRELMEKQGIFRDDIYTNTYEISQEVDAEMTFHENNFPTYNKRLNSDTYLKELAFDKLAELGLHKDEEYIDRLSDEIEVVTRLGFSDYMLLIWDMVHWARLQDIKVGPGRGSVGGSLLAYVLGITEVDPIKFGLTFWRFLQLDVEYDPIFTPKEDSSA